MKKVFVFLFLISVNIIAAAQTAKINKLKKELESHSRRDTSRVNRLIDLAAESDLNVKERKKYADEALVISQKINYEKGLGFAYVLLGSIEDILGNLPESEVMFHLADSLAHKTGNQGLKANVLWRISLIEPDIIKKDSLIEQAYVFADNIGNTLLQIKILLTSVTLAQNALQREAIFLKADSLAKKSGDLYSQAKIFIIKANYESDLQKRGPLYLEAVSVAREIGDIEFEALMLSWYGYFLASTGNKKAIPIYKEAEELASKSGNNILLSQIQLVIGGYYLSTISDYAKAMEYFLKSLQAAEIANDAERLIYVWSNLGALYSYMGDQDNALRYLLKAGDENKILGSNIIESDLQNSIGERYRLMGKYPEAIEAYERSLKLTKNPGSIAVGESNLAEVYTRMGNLPMAFQYGFGSLKRAEDVNDESLYSWIYGILSRAYLKKSMADSAIYYGINGLNFATQTGTIEMMRDNVLALANAYAAKNDFKKAYTNHLLYVAYRDSMMNAEVRNRTAVQQYTFNLDKKEAQISVLHEQKKGQRNLLIGALVLLGLILAIATLLLHNNRQKQKANRLLVKQKQEIDEKAQELAKQKENVELLSNIGRKITASLSVEKIIGTVYNSVNKLMDANVFGIGIYNDVLKRLEFPSTYENGESLPFYSNSIEDNNRFGSVCFTRGEEIAIGHLNEQYKDYIQEVPTPHEGGQPVSIIFLPLMTKGEKLGVITVQSFQKNAYSDYQLFMLRNIATYASIAIENAESYETLDKTFSTLKATQTQLIHSEKMASLGELTAGIAHEIQNPLNFVNNFSEVNMELIEEMKEEWIAGHPQQALEIAGDIKQNLAKISHHGKRADSIVKGMLQHSRTSTGTKESTDINALAEEYLRLSYHGLRAKDKFFNATFRTDFDESLRKIKAIPQDIGRVLLNVYNNAFFAVNEKKQQSKNGYEPLVFVSSKDLGHLIELTINDNGKGIPQEALDKIFQPFFTTKPSGQGTGLGLSLSYDIVKAHGGDISVESKEEEGTTFIISFPVT